MARLNNKVAVITGGTTGIGLATAKRFVEEGARVVLTGTNPTTLEAASAELNGTAEVVASDASSEKDVKALFDQVTQKHGKIDVLFLNAGIAKFAPWDQHSEEDFDRQFEINVKGPWLAIKHAIPALKDGASIIATTAPRAAVNPVRSAAVFPCWRGCWSARTRGSVAAVATAKVASGLPSSTTMTSYAVPCSVAARRRSSSGRLSASR